MGDRADELARLDSRFDELWPILRSITGPGFRESVGILQQDVPFELEGVASGNEVFDWTVPPEWRVRDARLSGPDGTVVVDLSESNLSIVNYSEPVDRSLNLDELDPHLFTLPDRPDAIPYVTSYYQRNWGFCLPHDRYESLPRGEYHAYIDSEFVDGELNFAHAVLAGESDREVLLSTYLCHPSLANNELSGPLVMTSLYRRISNWDRRKFTYRFVIVPETIGAVSYLARYGRHLRDNVVAGLVLTCLGGPRGDLSYKETRRGDALVDEVVRYVSGHGGRPFRFRQFDVTGSDERQYCSPGFNLPVGQFARTVYGNYDGYHNSLDTKEFMGIEPLVDSANAIEHVLRTLETAGYYINKQPYGEPMMSKRDMYPSVNTPTQWTNEGGPAEHDGPPDEDEFTTTLMRILNFSDGSRPLVHAANRYKIAPNVLATAVERLCDAGLLAPEERLPDYQNRFEPIPVSTGDS